MNYCIFGRATFDENKINLELIRLLLFKVMLTFFFLKKKKN
jgi:hypothetical protein